MAALTVSFRNPVTDAVVEGTRCDDSMTVREVIENLVQNNFIPPAKEGQHYVLQIKGKTELSSDDATLQSGGVSDGDMINVVLAQRGGDASCDLRS